MKETWTLLWRSLELSGEKHKQIPWDTGYPKNRTVEKARVIYINYIQHSITYSWNMLRDVLPYLLLYSQLLQWYTNKYWVHI